MADIKISQLGEALAVTDNDILPMTASGVTSKVKASTMKSYMVEDLDVSNLHDTTITTPTDNDGLVYNGTSQKWENKPVVTGDLWAQNGAHNLCPFPYYSGGTQIIANLTITVGSKGELTANGASDGDGNFIFYAGTLKKNTYKFKFKGTFTGGNLVLRVYDSTADIIIGNASGNNEITFQVDATNEDHIFGLFINWTGAQSITISGRPLLKLASDPTDDDTPYAMTNEELTEYEYGNCTPAITPDRNDEFAYVRRGKLVQIFIRNLGFSTMGGLKIGTCPYAPKGNAYFYGWDTGGTAIRMFIDTNGDIWVENNGGNLLYGSVTYISAK